MKSLLAILVVICLFSLGTSVKPLNYLDLNKIAGQNLNAVAYNNVNDSWASACLSFYFTPINNNTQVYFNTTLWLNPTPENFTLNVTNNTAVWVISPQDNLYWVYADYYNQVYAFADGWSMVSYVLAAEWTVSKIHIAQAIVQMINAEVPSAPYLTTAPAACQNTPMYEHQKNHSSYLRNGIIN